MQNVGDRTNICAFDCSLRCPEAQPNVLVPSSPTLSDSGALSPLDFLINEDVRLFLVGALRLYCQFGRHDCGSLWSRRRRRAGFCVGSQESR